MLKRQVPARIWSERANARSGALIASVFLVACQSSTPTRTNKKFEVVENAPGSAAANQEELTAGCPDAAELFSAYWEKDDQSWHISMDLMKVFGDMPLGRFSATELAAQPTAKGIAKVVGSVWLFPQDDAPACRVEIERYEIIHGDLTPDDRNAEYHGFARATGCASSVAPETLIWASDSGRVEGCQWRAARVKEGADWGKGFPPDLLKWDGLDQRPPQTLPAAYSARMPACQAPCLMQWRIAEVAATTPLRSIEITRFAARDVTYFIDNNERVPSAKIAVVNEVFSGPQTALRSIGSGHGPLGGAFFLNDEPKVLQFGRAAGNFDVPQHWPQNSAIGEDIFVQQQ
jgi:hypothetical protein